MTGLRVTHTLCTWPLLCPVCYVYSRTSVHIQKKKGEEWKKKKGKSVVCASLPTDVLSFWLSRVITMDCTAREVGAR